MLSVHPKEKSHEVATWQRPVQDITYYPTYPGMTSPYQSIASQREEDAKSRARVIRSEEIVKQIWEKVFSPKAKNATQAVEQIRLFRDMMLKHGDYDGKLAMGISEEETCLGLYAPHANLPVHFGVSWNYYKEHGKIESGKYGYIQKFFPNVRIAPHGYQIFGFLLCELIYGSPRMKASAVAERMKTVERYATAVPEFGDFTQYNNAVMNWAQDFSVSTSAFARRVDNLILLLKAWNGVPWPHGIYAKFLPAPKLGVPAFAEGLPYYDPELAMTPYFPRTVEEIQAEIASYLVRAEDEFIEHFGIMVREKIEKLKKKLEKAEKVGEVLMWAGLILTVVSLASGSPMIFNVVVTTIPMLALNYAALKNVSDKTLEGTKAIFDLLDFTEDNMETLRLWIAERADLPAVLPPSPGSEGKFSLWIDEKLVGSGDTVESIIAYAVSVAKEGQKIEIGNEETNSVSAVGLMKEDGKIEWMPESFAGKFQNLGRTERGNLVKSLSEKGGIPWWIIGVPLAALLVVD